jgi:short-subunit dehydrogenase
MRPLTGKVVLLTGASRGLGADMARRFARERARLALAARSMADLERVRADCAAVGAEAVAVAADVGDPVSLRALVEAVESSLGPVDVPVNNAGVEEVLDFERTSLERIEEIIRVNVLGVLWLTRLVVPSMIARRSGHVVNIASIAGLTPIPHNDIYSASKHAVVGFSRALRLELAEHGVGVSVLCPGPVDAGMFARWTERPPAVAGGVVSSRTVAEAVVQAVLRDRGEVVVARGLSRIGDWSFAIAPELAGRLMRRLGALDYLERQARAGAERTSG